MFDSKLTCKLIWLIPFEYFYVLLLSSPYIDGNSEELGLPHMIGRPPVPLYLLVSIIILPLGGRGLVLRLKLI